MTLRSLGLVWFSLFTVACSSIRPKPLDVHVNLGRRISALEEEVKMDQTSIANLLAPNELADADKKVREARRALFNAEPRERVLTKTGLAEAYVENVRRALAERQPAAVEILRERDAAVTAGALHAPETLRRFEALDELFRERVPRNAERRDRLVQGYRAVGVTAVEAGVLGGARERIAEARRLDARRTAPAALRTAERALARAERAIRRDPLRPAGYRARVNLANNLSHALISITAQARAVAARSREDVAREMLVQKQRVDQLRSELAGVELNARVAKARLRDATKEVQFNRAMEQARQDLGERDANVYRAGDRLLIRLKTDPTAAATLSKVKGVIRKLNGRDVLVQGGTARRAELVTESLNEVTRVGRLVGPESPSVEILVRPTVRR